MSDPHPRKLASESVISLHDLSAAVLEHIWIVSVCTLLGFFGGVYLIAKTPKVYQTTSRIEVVPPQNISGAPSTSPDDPTSDTSIRTLISLFNSKQFTRRVVDKLNLSQDPAYWQVAPGTALNHTPDETAGDLASPARIAAVQVPSTRLIDIVIHHGSPEVCVRLANTVALEFIEYQKDANSATVDSADANIKGEEDKIQQQVLADQHNLQAFREANQTVVLDPTALEAMNNRVAEANRTRLALESDLKQIQDHPNDPDVLLGLPSIASSPTITVLRNGIAQWQEQIAKMQQRYTEFHPKLIRGRQELASIKEALNRAALEVKDTVHSKYEAAYSEEKTLQEQAMRLNKIAIDYQNLTSDLESSRNQSAQIKKRKDEILMKKQEKTAGIALSSPSSDPVRISPNERRIWMTSVGSGLSAGLMIAFVFYILDSSIKRVEKAEALFKLPVLTVVPESQKRTLLDKGSGHPDDIEPTVKESFRSLIVALNLLGGPPGCKICLFTSSVPDEGKSFCSFHCATHLASQGKRTLLIDTDLRRPSLHRFLQTSEDQKGTSDLLSGQADFFDIVNPTAYANLSFLPSGSRAPNPIKLLSDGNFKKVLDIAMPNYDYIVLDTAPINAVADTLLLAEFAHHLSLIIRTGKTSVHAVKRSLQSLANARKEPSGIIMNRFIARRGAYYYYSYSYNKSYGPDEVYGRESKKTRKG